MLEEELSVCDDGSELLGASDALPRLQVFPVWQWDEESVAEDDVVVYGGLGCSALTVASSRQPEGSAALSGDSVEAELARLLGAASRPALAGPELVHTSGCGLELESLLAEELFAETEGSAAGASLVELPSPSAGRGATPSPPPRWSSPRFSGASRYGAGGGTPQQRSRQAGGSPERLPRTSSRASGISCISEPCASTVLTSPCGSQWVAADVEARRAVAETFTCPGQGSVGTSLTGSLPDSPLHGSGRGAAAAAGTGLGLAAGLAAGLSAAAAAASLAASGTPSLAQSFGGSASAGVVAAALAPVLGPGSQAVAPPPPPPWRTVRSADEASAVTEETGLTGSAFVLDDGDGQSTHTDLEFPGSLHLDLGQLLSARSPEQPQLSSDEARHLPKVRFQAPERQSCSICLEHFTQGMLVTGLQCGHVFHVDCLSAWVQRAAHCPNCRSRVEPCTGRGSPSPTRCPHGLGAST